VLEYPPLRQIACVDAAVAGLLVSELDISRAANLLIREQRADAMLEAAELLSTLRWTTATSTHD
jgi:hypothetical protein